MPAALFKILLALLLTSGCAAAQASYKIEARGSALTAARDVVRRYCQLDFEGARLSEATWGRLKPVTAWNKNPDFAAVKVISFYQQTDAQQVGRTVFVTVVYDVLGEFQPSFGYAAAPLKEAVSFEVRQSGDAWKIEHIEPSTLPHISRNRALTWIHEQVVAEKDPATKASLERAAAQLEKK